MIQTLAPHSSEHGLKIILRGGWNDVRGILPLTIPLPKSLTENNVASLVVLLLFGTEL